MPIVPKISAGSGTMPGEASTMPTMAVNTIRRLTLGLVSSRYSRQRQRCKLEARRAGDYRGASTRLKGTMPAAGSRAAAGLGGLWRARPERAQQRRP